MAWIIQNWMFDYSVINPPIMDGMNHPNRMLLYSVINQPILDGMNHPKMDVWLASVINHAIMDGIKFNRPKLDDYWTYWFPIENKKPNLDDFRMVCNNHPILDDYRWSKIIHIWNRTIPAWINQWERYSNNMTLCTLNWPSHLPFSSTGNHALYYRLCMWACARHRHCTCVFLVAIIITLHTQVLYQNCGVIPQLSANEIRLYRVQYVC